MVNNQMLFYNFLFKSNSKFFRDKQIIYNILEQFQVILFKDNGYCIFSLVIKQFLLSCRIYSNICLTNSHQSSDLNYLYVGRVNMNSEENHTNQNAVQTQKSLYS